MFRGIVNVVCDLGSLFYLCDWLWTHIWMNAHVKIVVIYIEKCNLKENGSWSPIQGSEHCVSSHFLRDCSEVLYVLTWECLIMQERVGVVLKRKVAVYGENGYLGRNINKRIMGGRQVCSRLLFGVCYISMLEWWNFSVKCIVCVFVVVSNEFWSASSGFYSALHSQLMVCKSSTANGCDVVPFTRRRVTFITCSTDSTDTVRFCMWIVWGNQEANRGSPAIVCRNPWSSSECDEIRVMKTVEDVVEQ